MGSAALSILYSKAEGLVLILLHLSPEDCCGPRHRQQEEGDCSPLFSAKLLVVHTGWSGRKGWKESTSYGRCAQEKCWGAWDCLNKEMREVIAASTKCGDSILELVLLSGMYYVIGLGLR